VWYLITTATGLTTICNQNNNNNNNISNGLLARSHKEESTKTEELHARNEKKKDQNEKS
jgi:hypothetical protein